MPQRDRAPEVGTVATSWTSRLTSMPSPFAPFDTGVPAEVVGGVCINRGTGLRR